MLTFIDEHTASTSAESPTVIEHLKEIATKDAPILSLDEMDVQKEIPKEKQNEEPFQQDEPITEDDEESISLSISLPSNGQDQAEGTNEYNCKLASASETKNKDLKDKILKIFSEDEEEHNPTKGDETGSSEGSFALDEDKFSEKHVFDNDEKPRERKVQSQFTKVSQIDAKLETSCDELPSNSTIMSEMKHSGKNQVSIICCINKKRAVTSKKWGFFVKICRLN